MVKNGLIVVSDDKIAFPIDSIKGNGLGVVYSIMNHIRFPVMIDGANEDILFDYYINNQSAIASTDTDEIPHGPIKLTIGPKRQMTELRYMAINNQYKSQYDIDEHLIFTRSSTYSMEVALKAASIITTDPVKIISLAAKADNINLSAIIVLQIRDLCEFLFYWTEAFKDYNKKAFKIYSEDEKQVSKTFSYMTCIMENSILDMSSIYYPNIKLNDICRPIKKGVSFYNKIEQFNKLLDKN